jgi:hypothetical protein
MNDEYKCCEMSGTPHDHIGMSQMSEDGQGIKYIGEDVMVEEDLMGPCAEAFKRGREAGIREAMEVVKEEYENTKPEERTDNIIITLLNGEDLLSRLSALSKTTEEKAP